VVQVGGVVTEAGKEGRICVRCSLVGLRENRESAAISPTHHHVHHPSLGDHQNRTGEKKREDFGTEKGGQITHQTREQAEAEP